MFRIGISFLLCKFVDHWFGTTCVAVGIKAIDIIVRALIVFDLDAVCWEIDPQYSL